MKTLCKPSWPSTRDGSRVPSPLTEAPLTFSECSTKASLMGQVFHWANLVLAFMIELCALAALGYRGVSVGGGLVAKTAPELGTLPFAARPDVHAALRAIAPSPSKPLCALDIPKAGKEIIRRLDRLVVVTQTGTDSVPSFLRSGPRQATLESASPYYYSNALLRNSQGWR